MKAKYVCERAYSLFETAIVLPILLIIIFGAIDINSALQAYTALQQGVHSTLRCLYTVDGKCVHTRATVDGKALFDWFKIQNSTEYARYLYDYQGEAFYLNRPIIHFTNVRAEILGGVSYDLPATTYSAQKNYYRANGLVDYMVREYTFPYLTGADARNPNFKILHNPSQNYPASGRITSDISRITLDASSDNFAEIVLPAINPLTSLPCFESANENDTPAEGIEHEAILTSATRCETNWPRGFHRPESYAEELSGFTYVVLHIKGIKDVDNDTSASVAVELEQAGHIKDLGGQFMTPGHEAANFIPRGAPLHFISHETRYAGPGSAGEHLEFNLYQAIKIRYGNREMRPHLRFRIARESGRGAARWRGTQVDIYTPVYRPVLNAAFQCEYGAAEDGSDCSLQGVEPELLPIKNTEFLYNDSERIFDHADPAVTLAHCVAVKPDTSESLQAMGYRDVTNYHLLEESCSAAHSTSSCPEAGESYLGLAPNYGVDDSSPDAETGLITASAQAQSICPPPIGASNIAWSVKTADIENHDGSGRTFDWEELRCGETVQVPSDLAAYRHLSYTEAGRTYAPLYTGERFDPRELIKDPNDYHSSDFNCGDFTVGSTVYDDITGSVELPNESLFVGIKAHPGCNWQELLQQDALENGGMDPAAFLEVRFDGPKGTEWVSSLPSCWDPDPEREITARYGDPEAELALGSFVDGIVPPECAPPGATCRSEFVGWEGEDGAGSESIFDKALAAAHYGFEEIRSAYPRARYDCDQDNCVKVGIEQSSDQKEMIVRGKINIPLNLLLRRTITLSYSAKRTLEREFAE